MIFYKSKFQTNKESVNPDINQISNKLIGMRKDFKVCTVCGEKTCYYIGLQSIECANPFCRCFKEV